MAAARRRRWGRVRGGVHGEVVVCAVGGCGPGRPQSRHRPARPALGEPTDTAWNPAHHPLEPRRLGGKSLARAAGASSHPAGPAPGCVVLVMSSWLALCEVGSQESSGGGFRRAELARREVGWIPVS